MKPINKELPKEVINFLNYKKATDKSENTITNYSLDLEKFFKFIRATEDNNLNDIDNTKIKDIGISEIRKITTDEINAYLGYLKDLEFTSSTRSRHLASIKSFFRYLTVTVHKINSNPADGIENIKLPERQPIYLTPVEAKEVLDSINNIRDRTIFAIFLNCGLRIEELRDLDIQSIKDGVLRVVGKGNKERFIPLNNVCLEAIEKYIEKRIKMEVVVTDKNALFISKKKHRMSVNAIRSVVNKYVKDNKITPHKLRHTMATMLVNAGVDIRTVQQLLGHKNISTTQIYTHLSTEKLQDAVNLNPLN